MAGNELVANFGEFKRRRESGSASMADLIQKLKAHVATQRNKLLEGVATHPDYEESERGPIRAKFSVESIYEKEISQTAMQEARGLLNLKWQQKSVSFPQAYFLESADPIAVGTRVALNQILGAVLLAEDNEHDFLKGDLVHEGSLDNRYLSIHEKHMHLLKDAQDILKGRGMQG